ncbi:glycosyltransferase [Shewanella inventionis]|uniref:Glycosyl transferase n=1 Tax=Shewanella inventionis TaxID=1738770 RepID=A0ABQ1JPI3_9GAMM|nr:MJ1255/VC2487 family glycosyltransferase [Shewanella inventionis]MCL1159100.1 glycosyltransferase [Shewanella inventionis]UAL43209.1 glycosyltransferase [Shewanella inventionis]GGB71336.1 glycosyl transferase [Shewanella inventionis]
MKILYGVQGTGNGHISRARVMAKALGQHQIDVDFLFSGRSPDQYFDMQCFADYQTRNGMTFITDNGRVNIVQTAKKNLMANIFSEIKQLDLSGYDLVLNDFEPVTAWAAKQQHVPSIAISHQAALKYPVPKQGASWFNELLLNRFAPVDISLGCHWHHFGFPILPPFVEVSTSSGDYSHQILVYLPFEDADRIAEFLAPFDQYQFFVYHGLKPLKGMAEHIHWHGFNREGFKQHMSQCGGVIGNAGFELASEAMTLGKKLLVKPLLGQFEQLANVAALQLLAAADSMNTLDVAVLKRWLKSPSPKPIAYPQVGDALVDWLKAGDWHQPESLCHNLWSQVELPENWHKRQ